MIKDFWKWHEIKSSLEERDNIVYFYEREIWLASFGINLGHEEDGKNERFLRPVVIMKKFNGDMFWGVPLTSTDRSYPHYYPIEINGRKSSLLLLQMRSIDRKRLFRKVGAINEKDFDGAKRRIVELLDIEKQIPSSGGDLQLTSESPEAEAKV
jgi:mRNA interferase MazF